MMIRRKFALSKTPPLSGPLWAPEGVYARNMALIPGFFVPLIAFLLSEDFRKKLANTQKFYIDGNSYNISQSKQLKFCFDA